MSEVSSGHPLLHVHALRDEHGDLIIHGNREGLELLRDHLNASLDGEATTSHTSSGTKRPMCADGEYYDLMVIRRDADWQSPEWQNASAPYYEKRRW